MLIEKFEKQVEKNPGNIAVKSGDMIFTYEQLNTWANRIARLILDSWPDNGNEQIPTVGLLLDHGPEMIAAILGTLKASKAYVPVSVDYPMERVAYMLSNSEAKLLVSSPAHREKAHELAARNGIATIDIENAGSCDGSRNPGREMRDNRVAYIMYTSGSTGWPKGVVQTHRNAEYYIRNWTRFFSITSADRMTLFSSFCHDGSVQDLFAALHNGAALYPFDMRSREKSVRLSDFLVRERITIWHSVPSLFTFFCTTLNNTCEFKDIRFILLGGEAVREHEVDVYQRFFPYSTLANVYGQTESSVDSICLIGPKDQFKKSLIGEPLDETRIFVVDKNGDEVDTLQTGEILVASPYISPGYWKNEAESAKTFKESEEFGRLYWTGDQGRLLLDGQIEFLGRRDNQVKIRGYRVEVGEIETRLFRHEKIQEAVVLAKTSETGELYLCAYVVPRLSLTPLTAAQASEPQDIESLFTISEMREYLSRELPDYMIPTHLVCLEKFPLTQSNKIDRRALPEPKHSRPTLDVNYIAPQTALEEGLTTIWKEVLELEKVGIHDNFFDLGGTSFDILKVNGRLNLLLQKEVPVVSLFRYPTISTFVEHIESEKEKEAGKVSTFFTEKDVTNRRAKLAPPPPIAVIGMAGRFPGAKNIEQFWENLKRGVETITFFSDEELRAQGVDEQLLKNPDYVKANALLEDIEFFDAAFFGYSPVEAGLMDPQLRIMHEVAWEALEDAGYTGEAYEGAIGVYAGNASNQYWVGLTFLQPQEGLDAVFLNSNYSTKVSYKLNLTGPSFIVSTACSTSLVAIHLACRGLIDGECDMAVAGGVSITIPDKEGYLYRKGMILSSDGHCRAFDERASGTVFGNGAGMVVLKKLENAVADGDTIAAVIKASAINNDGSRKVGVAAPSVEGQAEVIRAAQEAAGVEPETIGYVEAHGTGTLLGDPIEIEALSLAFGTVKRNYCGIGSVKTNIGHLNSSSGVAGFIKAVLMLKHRVIPASLHFETPNPKIDFKNSPFYVTTELKEWLPFSGADGNPLPLRAGLNSFGVGGTNAHAILEESPAGVMDSQEHLFCREAADREQARACPHLLLLSARTPTALEKMTENLVGYIKNKPGIDLADVAYTLQAGRKPFKFRRKYLCRSVEDCLTNLGQTPVFEMTEEKRPVIFMFSGQGSQYVNMGRDLYETEPVFREETDRCFAILEKLLDFNIKDILYPGMSGANPANPSEASAPSALSDHHALSIDQTAVTQPVIFVIEYALAKLLVYWGIKPYAMTGHSIGEYVAACISGVFSLDDALKLVVLRGKLMQQLPAGDMLSVPLAEKELLPLLEDGISLAAVNSPSHCVVSGPGEAIAAFAGKMKQAGHAVRELHTSHAFHSLMMEPILDEFTAAVQGIELHPPTIPYISNLTGTWISAGDAVNPAYWGRHIREAVRFNDGMVELLKAGSPIFLEIGPGRALTTFARQHRTPGNQLEILQLMRHPQEETGDVAFLIERIGQLWLHGVKINWDHLHRQQAGAPHRRKRIPLPTYPFQWQRFWLEGDPRKMWLQGESPTKQKKRGEKKADMAEWFYVPSWEEAPLDTVIEADDAQSIRWLFFIADHPLMNRLYQQLAQDNRDIAVVKPGSSFATAGNREFTLRPGAEEDYRQLLASLKVEKEDMLRIVHTWNVTGSAVPSLDETLERGFYSLLSFAQAIGKSTLKNRVEITVITDGVQAVNGSPVTAPTKATLHGAIQVIPREFSQVHCRSLDIPLEFASQEDGEQCLAHLSAEVTTWTADVHAAYRDNRRWHRIFKADRVSRVFNEPPVFKEKGVYLVTGGLGGIGLVLGGYLAKTFAARLILTGRSPFPPQEEWDAYLASHEEADSVGRKIRTLLEWQGYGAEVDVYRVDAADTEGMKRVVEQAEQRFGTINGVIHSAGIPDGALIQLRTKEMSEAVFAPKVSGTLVLEEALRGRTLDFFILCSSISAVLAPFGQAAYCAANAFLDAYAAQHSGDEKTQTLSINWDNWQEVGMAVNANLKGGQVTPGGSRPPSKNGAPIEHYLFDRAETQQDQHVFYIDLSVKKHWLLDEHRIAGTATLPGTGYLEIARAAYAETSGSIAAELRDVYFLSPLTVAEDETVEVRVVIEPQDEDMVFSISSPARQASQPPVEHARGKLRPLDTKSDHPSRGDLAAIRAACSGETITFDSAIFDGRSGAMTFGPRWNNLRQACFGAGLALGQLALPPAYTTDIGLYQLHPALLDVATTMMRAAVKEGEKGAYLPFSYKRLRFFAALSGELMVHAHETGYGGHSGEAGQAATSQKDAAPASPRETVQYDLTIMNTSGDVLVDIEGFTLKLVKMDSSRPHEKALSGLTAPLLSIPKDEENFSLTVVEGAVPGSFNGLEYRPARRVPPGPGEVEIEVIAAGLNFKEVLRVLGTIGAVEAGTTFGMECAGKITAVGEGVGKFAPGDPVVAFGKGCLSKYITVSVSFVLRKPANLSYEQAAAIPVAFMTAYYGLLKLGRLRAGEKVLIHSAAGGVGLAAIEVAHQAQAQVFATAGNDEKRACLRSIGIEYVMSSRNLSFADEIMKYTGDKGVDVVLNSLAGDFIPKSMSVLATQGRFIEIGIRDILNNTGLELRPFLKGLSYSAFQLTGELYDIEEAWAEIIQYFEDGDYQALPLSVFPAAQTARAFEYMTRGQHMGKLVVSHVADSFYQVAAVSAAVGKGAGDSRQAQTNALTEGILSAEGIEVFRRLAARPGIGQVVVSTTDFFKRLERAGSAPGISLATVASISTAAKYTRPELSTAYKPPVTPVEKQLAVIWQDLLGLDKVGLNDDFFELGGDSLKAVTFGGRIHKETGVEIPLSEFFNRPTVHQLAVYINEAGAAGTVSTYAEIEPVEDRECYALSPAQERLFILQELDRSSTGYNLPSVVRLEGKLDIERFEKAIKAVIERHESLRTSFHLVKGQPVQKIHAPEDLDFAVQYDDESGQTDQAGHPNDQGKSTGSTGISGNIPSQQRNSLFPGGVCRPFDLSSAPLLRVGLVRQAGASYLFMLDVHHIVCDGASTTLFFKEFIDIYSGKTLSPLKLRYRDYAEWVNSAAMHEMKKKQENYWVQRFSGEIPVIDLPLDFERPVVQSFAGGTRRFVIDEHAAAALKEAAAREDSTLFMILLALFNVLFMKLSGQEDIVIGTPTAGRRHTGLENIIGMFVNTLALRNYPAAGKTFREFLKEVRDDSLQAFENQDYQFEELVEKVDVRRDAARNPLFDIMFRTLNVATSGGSVDVEVEGLKLIRTEFNSGAAILDLDIAVWESENRLYFFIDYCSKLFTAETVDRFIDYFQRIARFVPRQLDEKIGHIEMISPQEKQQILDSFNDTDVDYPREKTVIQLFEEQAQQTPDRAALIGYSAAFSRGKQAVHPASQVKLTYRELHERVNMLAGQLTARGLKPGSIAGLVAGRYVEMLAGLLAIAKTGAAYLPIGPEYPPERMKYILEHSGAEMLLAFSQQVGPGYEGNVFDLREAISRTQSNSASLSDISKEPPAASEVVIQAASSRDPLYLIYTSGTTGIPKGVVIENRSVVNFIAGITGIIPFAPGDVVLSLTTAAFDIFGLETLLPLTQGAAVVLGSEMEQFDAAAAARVIEREKVTIFQVTPSRLQLFTGDDRATGSLGLLKYLLVGGEALPPALLEKTRPLVTGRIYNMYGPTETTIWSTVKDVSAGEALNIGKPIANTQIYILGPGNTLQPIGVTGELGIAGDGLARGYYKDEALTNEKFFESPFVPGSRVYRSGDLARWLPDGNLQCLGRVDHQVKIRGFRIELGEIESRLQTHEQIEEAVVIVRQDESDEKYLCAYLVLRDAGTGKTDQAIETAAESGSETGSIQPALLTELREYLAQKLPDYMIPAYFVAINKIPLSPNGKVDRKALPKPETSRLTTGSKYVEPSSANEKVLVQLWQEVLKVDKVGIDDNFFELGGSSLKIVQLNRKLTEVLQQDIPVASMFRYPTIRSLLKYLSDEAVIDVLSDAAIDESREEMEETMQLFLGAEDDE